MWWWRDREVGGETRGMRQEKEHVFVYLIRYALLKHGKGKASHERGHQ
jgi:hypothetical protein